jgi:hypothetical protein
MEQDMRARAEKELAMREELLTFVTDELASILAGLSPSPSLPPCLPASLSLSLSRARALSLYTCSLRPHALVAYGLIHSKLKASYSSSVRPYTLVA